MIRKTRCSLFFAGFIFLIHDASMAAVLIEGDASVNVWVNGTEAKAVTATFQGELEPQRYHLSIQFNYFIGSGPLAQEISYENGSTLQTTHWKPEGSKNPGKGEIHYDSVVTKASVGTMPRLLPPIALAPWIAYCSHVHSFKQTVHPEAYDYLLPGASGAELTFSTDDAPKLTFGHPLVDFIRPSKSKTRPSFENLPASLDVPHVGARFQALELKKNNGIAIISRAQMVYTNYGKIPNSTDVGLNLTDQITVELKSIKDVGDGLDSKLFLSTEPRGKGP